MELRSMHKSGILMWGGARKNLPASLRKGQGTDGLLDSGWGEMSPFASHWFDV